MSEDYGNNNEEKSNHVKKCRIDWPSLKSKKITNLHKQTFLAVDAALGTSARVQTGSLFYEQGLSLAIHTQKQVAESKSRQFTLILRGI